VSEYRHLVLMREMQSIGKQLRTVTLVVSLIKRIPVDLIAIAARHKAVTTDRSSLMPCLSQCQVSEYRHLVLLREMQSIGEQLRAVTLVVSLIKRIPVDLIAIATRHKAVTTDRSSLMPCLGQCQVREHRHLVLMREMQSIGKQLRAVTLVVSLIKRILVILIAPMLGKPSLGLLHRAISLQSDLVLRLCLGFQQ